jgi:hypothetical protein
MTARRVIPRLGLSPSIIDLSLHDILYRQAEPTTKEMLLDVGSFICRQAMLQQIHFESVVRDILEAMEKVRIGHKSGHSPKIAVSEAFEEIPAIQ